MTSMNNNTNIFSRQMEINHIYGWTAGGWNNASDVESRIFCDSNITTTNSFLDSIDCVPYRSKDYESAVVYNSYGKIVTQVCDDQESGFTFPRQIKDNETDYFHRYECCKNWSLPSLSAQPYVKDKMFDFTVYPQ